MVRGFKSEDRTTPDVDVFDLNLERNHRENEPIQFEELHFIKLVCETEKAIKVKARDFSEIWLPKSVIRNPNFKEKKVALLPEWFIEANHMWDIIGEWEYEEELLPRGL